MGWSYRSQDERDQLLTASANGPDVVPTSDVGAAWGGITGTLASQTDLQTALDAKDTAIALKRTTSADVDLATGKALRTSTTTAHTGLIQAYDVDGTAYVTFVTLTNGNTPTATISQPTGGKLVFIVPTSDPGVTGALWNNAGTLSLSA